MDLQGEMDTNEEQQQLELTKVRIKTVRFKSINSVIMFWKSCMCFQELEDCRKVLGAERDYEALKVTQHTILDVK